jgi:hypothetical protein
MPLFSAAETKSLPKSIAQQMLLGRTEYVLAEILTKDSNLVYCIDMWVRS